MLKFWKKKPAETSPAPPAEAPATGVLQEAAPPAPPVAVAEVAVPAVVEAPEAAPARRGWRERLAGSALGRGLGNLFQRNPRLDDDLLDELETTLITADVGVEASSALVEDLRRRMHKREFADAAALREALREALVALLKPVQQPLEPAGRKPFMVLTVGINGVGKTTTIGKLARRWRDEGRGVLLA